MTRVYIGSSEAGPGNIYKAVYNFGLLRSSLTESEPLTMDIRRAYEHDFHKDVIAEHGSFVIGYRQTMTSHSHAGDKNSDGHIVAKYDFTGTGVMDIAGCRFKTVSYNLELETNALPGEKNTTTAAFLPELGIPISALNNVLVFLKEQRAAMSVQTKFKPLSAD